uniref:Uncharacterized protein n=1 Tax=Mycena chlorophos TaxID=658473 RepID=A0ABQ0LLI6_MYCCL|nr:predicted protein [Mycena chlorophos]
MPRHLDQVAALRDRSRHNLPSTLHRGVGLAWTFEGNDRYPSTSKTVTVFDETPVRYAAIRWPTQGSTSPLDWPSMSIPPLHVTVLTPSTHRRQ